MEKTGLVEKLLPWFEKNKRSFPWREDPSVYRVWISEIMLQQTRAETVVPYFLRFLELFPDVFALADAPLEKVLKAWEGLGYYSRARHIHLAAKAIAEKKVFPSDRDGFLLLEGVGAYTAGAIASIALNQPVPAVDGNVLRVFSRLYAIPEDTTLSSTRKAIAGLVETLIPQNEASNFNQALMELGATICSPLSPACSSCPIASCCEARSLGRAVEFPVKAKKKAPRREIWLSAVIECEGKFLLRKRPPEGLLGGLFEFPWIVAEQDEAGISIEEFAGEMGLEIEKCRPLTSFVHLFSHIRAEVRVYRAESRSICCLAEHLWLSPEAFEEIPWTRIGNRIRSELSWKP